MNYGWARRWYLDTSDDNLVVGAKIENRSVTISKCLGVVKLQLNVDGVVKSKYRLLDHQHSSMLVKQRESSRQFVDRQQKRKQKHILEERGLQRSRLGGTELAKKIQTS